MLPLFVLAHFGYHIVGALLRPLLPMIRDDLGLTYTQVGLVTSAFAITGGISQLPAGFLADRFGARLMVGLAVAGVAVTGLLIGLTHSYLLLIMLLILAAVLGAGYHPAAATAISDVVPAERRGMALGIHLIGGSSCFWVVPVLAAPLVAVWTWQNVYLAMSAPALVLGVVLWLLLGKHTRRPALRPPAAAPTPGVRPSWRQRLLRLLLGVFGGVSWRKMVPFLLISVAGGTILQSVTAYLSLFAVDELHVSQSVASLLMAVTPAVGLFAAPMGGFLSDRFGGVPVLIISALATVPLTWALGLAATVPSFVIVMVALGVASNARMPTSESYIIGNVPEKRRATVLGLYYFAASEISGIMTPFMGNLIDRVGFQDSFTIAAIISGVITVGCALFMWWDHRRGRNNQ